MTESAPPVVVVVGGCGHVGLPLSLALGRAGLRTAAYDIDLAAVTQIQQGSVPFKEPGAQDLLRRLLPSGEFSATADPAVLRSAEVVIVVVGTPVDETLSPNPDSVPGAVRQLTPFLKDGQLLILRSTVYPGVTKLVEEQLARSGLSLDVAFCPERIAEGHALTELTTLPQIVAARSEHVADRAAAIFRRLTSDIVLLSPEEAELAKLFTNTWRYIMFAATNQLYMIANDYGLDYERIRSAVTHNYPRAADIPTAGFAAGPCLFKDTVQLSAFHNDKFSLGDASMVVNEGLPLYLVDRMETRFDLESTTVGILGMAFKAESDDIRSSLSYKLRDILRVRAKNVLCADPWVTADPSLSPLEHVLAESDVCVIGAPHAEYRQMQFTQPVIDIWNVRGEGVLV